MNLRNTIMAAASIAMVPFSVIWMATEAPQTFERWRPRLEISKVEEFKVDKTGFSLKGTTLHFKRECTIKRSIYVESSITAYLVRRQFLLPTFDENGEPIAFNRAFHIGDSFTVPYMHVMTTPDVASHLHELRFEVACIDDDSGIITPSFSNTVHIGSNKEEPASAAID